MRSLKQLFLGTCLIAAATATVSVSAYAQPTPTPVAPSKESANYSKADKLLPGEEVVTPTGQRLKVWSTQGPVEVSKAPEPFEDGDDAQTPDVHVVIDGQRLLKQHQAGNPSPAGSGADSFNHAK